MHLGIHLAERQSRGAKPCHDPCLARNQCRFARRAQWHQAQCRPVEQPVQVLTYRQPDDLPAIILDVCIPLELVKFFGHEGDTGMKVVVQAAAWLILTVQQGI